MNGILFCHAGGAKPLREKQVPGLLDVFGWCTWDAFYSRVSARGKYPQGMMSLAEPPRVHEALVALKSRMLSLRIRHISLTCAKA